MAILRIKQAAVRDLDDQIDYLAERNPTAARRYAGAARTTFQKLSDMPGIGASKELEFPRHPGLRMSRVIGFPNYLVFYVQISGGIEVVRIIHGARDVYRALEEPLA